MITKERWKNEEKKNEIRKTKIETFDIFGKIKLISKKNITFKIQNNMILFCIKKKKSKIKRWQLVALIGCHWCHLKKALQNFFAKNFLGKLLKIRYLLKYLFIKKIKVNAFYVALVAPD
jgi:hypothetical protein